ncbi:hypothetical protein NC651_009240 [Populus alba x Populus x berolinensis]|nr:hypothetical protein NC651_009240 [Populus alba x Populus x berolinensis]
MRGADCAGDSRKGHPFPLNIFLSSSPDTQIPAVIRVQAVAQSWLRARGSDQPQLAKKLRDKSSQISNGLDAVFGFQNLGPFELVLDCGKGGRSSLCSCPTAPRHSYASVQKKARRRVTDSGFDHNQSRVVTSDFV